MLLLLYSPAGRIGWFFGGTGDHGRVAREPRLHPTLPTYTEQYNCSRVV